jgi:hypothetical protein
VLLLCPLTGETKDETAVTEQHREEKTRGKDIFSPWKADELMGSSTRSMASPFQEKTQKMGSNEREIRPTDRPVRVERNRWFKRFLITAIVITRERALLSLGCATFNSGIRTFLPPVESPSLLLFSPLSLL